MNLTILGRVSPFPGPNGVCPGYLVTSGPTKILVDCGSGSLTALARLGLAAGGAAGGPVGGTAGEAVGGARGDGASSRPFAGLTAVVLSHLHWDHFSDLMVLRYAAAVDRRDGYRPDGPLPVYAPAEPSPEARLLSYQDALRHVAMSAGDEVTIGDLVIAARRTSHPLPCHALEIRERDGGGHRARLVYTADTGYDDDLLAWAAGADLLLIEASLNEATVQYASTLGHLTARQAGAFAARARVREALITHVGPAFDLSEHLAQAREGAAEAGGAPGTDWLSIAVEGKTYCLEGTGAPAPKQ